MKPVFEHASHQIVVQQVGLAVAALQRGGTGAPILFLHGFGSTKEDYADIARWSAFDGQPFLAYDAPGCGETVCVAPSKISIPFLVETAMAMLDRVGFDRFHLVGHSMGGLTALLLAHACPQRVLSFVNIEGNVAPEDCFLSRQIHDYPSEDAQRFLDDFIERARRAPALASALYAAGLRHKVHVEAVRPIFTSMVDLSDNGRLMDRFVGLPCPKLFMYGDENAHLSYLAALASKGIALARIAQSNHWPMYSAPAEMWRRIAEFQRGST
ncbi:alpha/beta fold hydrolase [Novosphingobium sp. NDB2Meth1]|uniref:alpha/beta fold hydrolase n=1 Tax=Novosphingobium sp. NDB2Meth1 TaxID=1892847 RepID=UPI0009307A99|nr:alpha/beta hydrolase [Novosphingobium sp. NDB2Meth1]